MNGPTLLSGSEIGLIRRYVATKYAHLPAARRADIVADAIRRAVFRRLPALPHAWRLELAEELIRRCLVLERRDIRREDVLAVCAGRKWDERLIREAVTAWAQWEAPEDAAAGTPAGVMAPGSGESARKPASLAAEVRGEPAQATAPEEKGVSHPPSVFSVAGSVPLLPSASEILNASPPSVSESREAQAPPAAVEPAPILPTAVPTLAMQTSASAVPAADRNRAEEPLAGNGTTGSQTVSFLPRILCRLRSPGRRPVPAALVFAGTGAAAVSAAERPASSPSPVAWAAAAFLLTAGIWFALPKSAHEEPAVPAEPQPRAAAEKTVPEAVPAPADEPGMPPEFRYAEFDREAVKTYLRSRDSLLAEEPYFGAIVESGREHDVHPLLLFAIAGQEQGFVPKTHKYAEQIANNPFNVYESWEKYNTDIRDSADIAARTVANLAGRRPAGYDPFLWLNTRYAEDPAWADGVRWFFDKLVSVSKGENLPASSAVSPSSS
mgnify:CR=1 FL=1